MADVKSDIVLGIHILTMSNAVDDFQAQDVQWRSYTTRNVLSNTKKVELIRKKEFAVATLNPEHKIFVVHITVLIVYSKDNVHPLRKAQISYLKVDETSIEVSSKYADFADVFSLKLVTKLPELTRINDHTIELVND